MPTIKEICKEIKSMDSIQLEQVENAVNLRREKLGEEEEVYESFSEHLPY